MDLTRFHPPEDENATLYKQVFKHDSHGHSGPIHSSFPEWVHAGEVPFQQVCFICVYNFQIGLFMFMLLDYAEHWHQTLKRSGRLPFFPTTVFLYPCLMKTVFSMVEM